MSTISSDDKFYSRVHELEKKLGSAFRKGLNVSVQGLHRLAPSDHLPIMATFTMSKGKRLNLLSWNILSDTHLGNYYRNVTLVNKLLAEPSIPKDNGFKTRGHWLLFFMADFMRRSQPNNITLTRELMERFVKEYPFENGFSKKDAKEIIDHYLNSPEDKQELLFHSVAHAIEIHFSISEGYLRWQNRFALIKTNSALQKVLGKQDIICLQECTRPEDMTSLLHPAFVSLHHSVRKDDHAVIAFDSSKYMIVEDENKKPAIVKFSLCNKTKPCLLVKLKSITDSSLKPFIVGSIHHPGGDEDELNEITAAVKELQSGEELDVFVLGDFNHEEDFFQSVPHNFSVKMPEAGTMAGPDYGSTNTAIDGCLTNRGDKLKLNVVQMPHARPITLPLHIQRHD